MASVSYIVRNCLSMGVNLYAPCVALNTVADIPYWASLSLMTIITIFLTFLVSLIIPLASDERLRSIHLQGGMKAAITADAIQGFVLIFVTVMIAIQGVLETGDVHSVYQLNKDNGEFRPM